MRLGPILLLAVALLAGVAWALREAPVEAPRATEVVAPEPARPKTAEEQALLDRLDIKRGVLTIRARDPEGEIPKGTEVGYRLPDGRTRWLYLGEDGQRTLEDAPFGRLTCVARAPGFASQTQVGVVLQGVRCEVLITLQPRAPADSDG